MGFSHALLLPYPAQGHVIPLMELAHCLVDHGFKITFVNTEFNHDRVVAALSKKHVAAEKDHIKLVSVPDGMDSGADRNKIGELTESLLRVMPSCLEELIRKMNESGGDKFTCMIVDESMAWALNVAKKMGLRAAAFWPSSASLLITMLSIPKLIEDDIIDSNGIPKKAKFQLAPGMPYMSSANFVWNYSGDSKANQIIYNYIVKNNRATEIAEFIICNSFNDIELEAFTYSPNLLPIGPLLTGQRFGKPFGNFWSEDSTCTAWLDQQQTNSVIYVAFGSFTIFDQQQFLELALALELTGQPFLWVVRPDITDGLSSAFPPGFQERVADRGRMVGWSPQQKVLAHPSVACFLSHCGWNSTMEGVTYGVPFLCWPYFSDQFLNQNYICDAWKTGLKVTPDEKGFIPREEIKQKLEEVLCNEEMRKRAQKLKAMARKNVKKGGASFENFITFVKGMKE